MQSGRIILIFLAATLAYAPPCPAWGPGAATTQAWRSFDAPPPPPEPKPHALKLLSLASVHSEMTCLAQTIYWEARGEPHDGQLAVAHVVLNRLGRPGFADTVCGVVHQGSRHRPCQFHWYCRNGRSLVPKDSEAWEESQRVALEALAEMDPTDGATYFHLASLRPPWIKGRYEGVRVIGHHIFFRPRPEDEVLQTAAQTDEAPRADRVGAPAG